MLRGIAIGKAIEDVAQTFMMHQSDLLNGNFKGKDLLALCSPQVQNTLEKAKELARTRISAERITQLKANIRQQEAVAETMTKSLEASKNELDSVDRKSVV